MNKNIILLVSCLLIAVMIFTSCASHAEDLMKGVEPKAESLKAEKMDDKLNLAIMNFTWNMFKESSLNEGNIMVSSPSIYYALAMTLNGAEGDTKAAMQKSLAAQELTIDDINIGLRDWLRSMTTDDSKSKLSVANSIWLRKGFEADREFLQRNADYYNASLKSLDFNKKSSVAVINKWVKDETEGKIDKIVDNISNNTMMYLINAIYFKSDWEEQFSANNTFSMNFNAPNGKVNAKFMNRKGEIEHLNANKITGVKLPYANERYAFFGLLPEEGQTPREFINNLTVSELRAVLNSGVKEGLELSMPKFEARYEDSLKNELSKIGMEIAFDPGYADFSLMKKNRDKDLFINEVKHKTFIKVDEKGTEAAAVTSVEMAETALVTNEIPKIVFDRPFIYGIIDTETGIPLFIGIMENPSK